MQILRGVAQFKKYLENDEIQFGCLADTGFLYALAYKDDRLFEHANDFENCFSDPLQQISAKAILLL